MNIYDAAVASPPWSSDRPDAVRGPWVALLTDDSGQSRTLDDFCNSGLYPEITVVRICDATADLSERDVLCGVSQFADHREDLADRWAQARLIAALLNHNQDKLDALAERAAGKEQ